MIKKICHSKHDCTFFTLFPNIVEHIWTENIENSAQQQVQLFSQ